MARVSLNKAPRARSVGTPDKRATLCRYTLGDAGTAGPLASFLRGGAVVARQSHKLEVAGSNPAPAMCSRRPAVPGLAFGGELVSTGRLKKTGASRGWSEGLVKKFDQVSKAKRQLELPAWMAAAVMNGALPQARA